MKAVVIAMMGIIILLVEGTQKEPSTFEHPKHVLKLMGKKYLQFYAQKFVYLNLCIFLYNNFIVEIQKNLFTQDRQQLKTLLTFDRTRIKKSTFADSINLFDCHLSGVLLDCFLIIFNEAVVLNT